MLKLLQPPSEGTYPAPHPAYVTWIRRGALTWIVHEAALVADGASFREMVGAANFGFAAPILEEYLNAGVDADEAAKMLAGNRLDVDYLAAVPSQRLALVTS